jgi:PAS domain S-box-containing protein
VKIKTFEELETAKEELQSTNEELTTLNDELKNHNQTLSLLNDDLDNLMKSIDAAVVIVDNEFKIRRFNSSAESLLGLMPSDVNNLITGIRLRIPIENFEKTLSRGFRFEEVREEVRTEKNHWYQMRVRPYLTYEEKEAGLVISFVDITEIKKLEDKLKVVSGFTRHDVRNKLAIINGLLYLANKQVQDPNEIQKYLNKIPETIAKIERILDISKFYEIIGSQKLELIDVGKSFDNASLLFADLKGIKLVNEAREFKVLADQMLTTIFSNLIDNTIKYGEKTTQIKIYTEKTDDNVKIVYEDDGVGISIGDKMRLFEKGFGKGTGYGLFLIKRTCEIYGWHISEEGEPGKGVKFIMSIPKKL